MHNKLSQAVKLYDQLLTAQVTHPSKRNTTTSNPTYPNALRQVVQDSWAPPPPVSSPILTHSQTHPTTHTQIGTPSPHIPPPFSTSGPRPTGYLPASSPFQTFRAVDSPVTSSSHGFPQATSPHPSQSPPPQGANLRTLSPPRQGTTSIISPPLPTFPIAPTLAPQSNYLPSVPQSVIKQPDRQEALLIDL